MAIPEHDPVDERIFEITHGTNRATFNKEKARGQVNVNHTEDPFGKESSEKVSDGSPEFEVSRFKKKPVVIEAVQLTWGNWNEMCNFLDGIISESNPGRDVATFSDRCGEQGPTYIELTIPTLEGDHVAKHGDWIIKGVKGEFYPCKPDIFEETYEKV